jgi:hypothetical protein
MLSPPTTDDFLPQPEPHNTTEQHGVVEGAPGLGGPANTLPEPNVTPPSVLPDSGPVGPDKPHGF